MEDRTPGRRASDWQPIIEAARDEAIPPALVVREPETALDALHACRRKWSEIHQQMDLGMECPPDHDPSAWDLGYGIPLRP